MGMKHLLCVLVALGLFVAARVDGEEKVYEIPSEIASPLVEQGLHDAFKEVLGEGRKLQAANFQRFNDYYTDTFYGRWEGPCQTWHGYSGGGENAPHGFPGGYANGVVPSYL